MVITSRKNDAVKRFRELLREKSARDAQGVFAVEGDHLCGELAKSGYGIISVLTTERAGRYRSAQKKSTRRRPRFSGRNAATSLSYPAMLRNTFQTQRLRRGCLPLLRNQLVPG